MPRAQRILARLGLLPGTVLERVQLALLALWGTVAFAVIILLLTDDIAEQGRPVPSALSVLGLWLLGAVSYHHRSVPWPFLPVEVALLAVACATQGADGWVISVAMAAIFFRTSLGSVRATVVLVVAWTAGITAGLLSTSYVGVELNVPYEGQDAAFIAVTVMLLATPARIVVAVLARYEASVARERALLSAGIALVATGSPEEVGVVAVRAADVLVEGTGGVVRWLDAAVLDLTGSTAATRLDEGHEVLVLGPDDAPARGALGLGAASTAAVVVVVVATEAHRRLLLVESPVPLPPTVVDSLAALASTLGLGLRSVAAAHQLRRQALEDPLTGLANRALLEERLLDATARADYSGQPSAAVLLIDLDGFKEVNDRLGHAAGDTVLVAMAHRLRECARPTDTVARLGGDEFVVLVESLPAEQDVGTLAERVLLALCAPVSIGTEEARVSASIGVALVQPGEPPAHALEAADSAMYAAKAAGRANYVVAATVSTGTAAPTGPDAHVG